MPAIFSRNCWSSRKGSKPPNQKRAPLQPQPAKLKTHCLNCSATNLPCPLSNSSTSCASSGPLITRTQPKKPSCPSSPYPNRFVIPKPNAAESASHGARQAISRLHHGGRALVSVL